ncbi:MAG: DNA polymerase III subunit beta [Novosphingobium sp.]
MAVKLQPDDAPPVDVRKPAVRIKAGSLLAALKDVLGVIEARNTIPLLSHVLIGAGEGAVTLTGTDLDIWARRDLTSDDRDGPGSKDWRDSIKGFAIALPAKPLADVLGEIDGDAMVTLTAPCSGPNGTEVRAVVQAGRARFKLACLPAEEFPLPPHIDVAAEFELPCSRLADAFAAVEHAISTEETRYYLNGVYLHPHQDEGEPQVLRFATTDGHRLARLTLDLPDGAASWPSVIVGRKTVGVLDKLLAAAAKTTEGKEVAPASVLVEANGLTKGCLLRFELPAADGGTIEITAKTIDGDFPDYARVIPAAPALRAVLARAPLAAAVKRVAVLSEGKSRAVKAAFSDGRVTLSSRSVELGEASEELECEYRGPDATLGFDAKYWRDALLAVATDQIAMAFDAPEESGGSAGPVRIAAWDGNGEAGALVQVLMPVRV